MNVALTKELDLCLSCEICHAICPTSAISMKYTHGQFLPHIDAVKCTDCGTCLAVCPGIAIDPGDIHNNTPSEVMFDGPYLETYTAYSNNLQIRSKSTSGGVITALILALLETKEYQAAFVLHFDKFENKPARLTPMSQTKDIINSTGSKYIPASVYEIVKSLQNSPEAKYIIVGTPCQFQGVRNYLKYIKHSDTNHLFLGLFCDKTFNYNIFRYFSDRYKKPRENIVSYLFRSKVPNGWPGDIKMTFNSGRELMIDKSMRMNLKPYFQLNRCLFCLDKSNVTADISCGDCYIPGAGDSSGKSSVVIRTEKGKKVFNKHSNIFTLETALMEEISASQQLSGRQENLKYAKYLIESQKLRPDSPNAVQLPVDILKRLSRLQKHIRWGERYNKKRINLALLIQRFNNILKFTSQITAAGIAFVEYLLFNLFKKSKRDAATRTKRNIIIIGGGLLNKGAQAMTFTVVDRIKRVLPDKDIYVFSSPDFRRPVRERSKYCFQFRPWDIFTAFRLSGFLGRHLMSKSNEWQEERTTKEIIQNASCFIDISGFGLSSEFGFITSWYYLINIMIAKKFSVPYDIFPQSIGPFDYPYHYRFFFSPIVRLFLKYAGMICPREEAGVNVLRKYLKRNIEKHPDIVLQNDGYEISNIFSDSPVLEEVKIKADSVGIVPNQRVMERTDKEELMEVYETLINSILSSGKMVYIVRHSHEDLDICTSIKARFIDNSAVTLISKDFNAIELENIIRQFDFIIASRYHAIIHAYRNTVPAMVIGWANKYRELLKDFRQLNYYFNCRNPIRDTEITARLGELTKNYKQESQTITRVLAQIRTENFFNIFEAYRI